MNRLIKVPQNMGNKIFSLKVQRDLSYGYLGLNWTPFGDDKSVSSNEMIDFINAGEIKLLVGVNGSGKSTLMKNLCGLNLSLRSSIFFESCEENTSLAINNLSLLEKSSLFSFEEFLPLNEINLRVKEFIDLSSDQYLSRPIFSPNFSDEFMKNLILEIIPLSWMNKKIFSLSRGQQVLVQLAQTLLQNTPLIFLDELFAPLDFIEKKRVLEILKKISSTGKKAFLITCHDADIIKSFSEDRSVWYLKKDQHQNYMLKNMSGLNVYEDICSHSTVKQ